MRLKSVRDSSLEELNHRADTFVAACGYEHRSPAISRLVTGPEHKVALCFKEWSGALARKDNEKEFIERGYQIQHVGSNESSKVQSIVSCLAGAESSCNAIAFDISTMTRAWHGGIIRELRNMNVGHEVETFFAYVPAKFKRPPVRCLPNEFVSPVDGFASLSTPDLPIAAVIGLGYERERALGLKQLLDPQQTLLMLPRSDGQDPYYPEVLKSNRNLLSATPAEWTFQYSIAQPAATFATLASLVAGLRESYRVVLASLGPKIFGILCFLLATRFTDISVWRVSSGIHAQPRDIHADMDRVVIFSASWE